MAVRAIRNAKGLCGGVLPWEAVLLWEAVWLCGVVMLAVAEVMLIGSPAAAAVARWSGRTAFEPGASGVVA